MVFSSSLIISLSFSKGLVANLLYISISYFHCTSWIMVARFTIFSSFFFLVGGGVPLWISSFIQSVLSLRWIYSKGIKSLNYYHSWYSWNVLHSKLFYDETDFAPLNAKDVLLCLLSTFINLLSDTGLYYNVFQTKKYSLLNYCYGVLF